MCFVVVFARDTFAHAFVVSSCRSTECVCVHCGGLLVSCSFCCLAQRALRFSACIVTVAGDPAAAGHFDPKTGCGFVAACDGDYALTKSLGHNVRALVFESFGGFGVEVMRLLKRLKTDVGNKLSAQQYDEASWSTRSWLALQTQRLSVALHLALAWEVGCELGLGVCLGLGGGGEGGRGAVAA